VRPVALSADGKILAVPVSERRVERNPEGGTISHEPDQWIHWCDASTGKELRKIKLETTWQIPQFIALSPDENRFACVGEGRKIIIWDRAGAKPLHHLAGHDESLLCGAFSGDGKLLATGGMDKIVRLWNVTDGRNIRELKKHESSVRWLGFRRDGTTLVTASRDRVCVWNSATGKLLRELQAPEEDLMSAALSPTSPHLAAIGYDGLITIWHLDTGQELHTFTGHRGRVNALAFSPDRKTLISGGSDAILVWDFAKRTLIRKLGSRGVRAESLVFLPDGNLIVGDSFEAPQRWDPATGKLLGTFKGPKQSAHLRLSPDGKLLASLAWKRWDSKEALPLGYLWSVEKAECLGGFGARKDNESVIGIAFNPPSVAKMRNYLPVGVHSDGDLSRTPLATFGDSFAFSPDGRIVVTSIYEVIAFYDAKSGAKLGEFGKQAAYGIGREWPIVFSADGRSLAVGDKDGLVRLIEVATRLERRQFKGHPGYVHAIAFAPDGKTLVSAGDDPAILVWDLGAAKPMSISEAWIALAGADAERAFDAIGALAAAPKETLAFIKPRLPTLRPIEPAALRKRIADLESADFKTRNQAMVDLEMQQELAVAELRAALAANPPIEARRRIEDLLGRTQPDALADGSERLRWLRVIELLERLDLPDADAMLRSLADGSKETQVARIALESVERRQKAGR
jgi:WD40 repeat protein